MKRIALVGLLVAGCAHEKPATVAQAKTEPQPVAAHEHAAAAAQPAKLYDDLGDYHRAVTTKVPEAQRYFDQGLRLTYAFNHEEAQRSFEAAAAHDPSCAACYWGAAMVLGPNYNQPAGAERAKKALALLARATAAPNASPVERALIAALQKRYVDPPPAADDTKGQAALDEAYANAMRDVAHKFPADDDVQVLFAESMMDLRPWRLWEPDSKPAPGTEEVVATLEKVMARTPTHPGANHYYIHCVEASPHPEKALPAADRIGGMMPGAGHLVHMPSHVYQRVGRYNDAAEANRKAIVADKKYTGTIGDPGYYAMYVAHNFQFLWASALMAGRGDESLAAARDMLKLVPAEMWKQMPEVSFSIAAPALSLVRFGRWEEVLKEPAPPADLPMPTILHHYARGRALAALGKLDDADAEVAAMQKVVATLPKTAVAGFTPGDQYASAAIDLVRGDLACRRGKTADGIALLKKAVATADGFPYAEPPDWYYPPRQTLGAWLLRAKKPAEAQKVFEEDLKKNPDNGWSLTGLKEALRAQKKSTTAVDARLAKAWSAADVQVASSDF
ncbi:MAG: tetratricopeptide repeat protein [Polyangia bacterium]